MRKVTYLSLLLLSITWIFLAYSWFGHHTAANHGARERKILYYIDPMNPSHTSDKAGLAPCGMPMEPVYADEETEEVSMSPGSVKISSRKQQLIGVRVDCVKETSRTRVYRTIGRVAPDEARVHRVIAGAPGFVREVSDVTTYSHVKKDQWLASFSSPDSIASIQAYIVALNAMDRLRGDNAGVAAENLEGGATYQLRVEKLQELGFSTAQMEEIRETRAVPRKINVLSPVGGLVLTRDISPGQRFDRGFEWYRIADLSRVWIVADVYDRDAQYIEPGMRARVSLPHQEKVFDAVVTHVPPQFDAARRALKVRMETDNPEYVLRPDMLVDVELQITFPSAITVPSDAVLNSGREQMVFVENGEGVFEPRQVKTGRRFDEGVEIVSGLTEGEQIVTSGNFMLDSESRMKGGITGSAGELAKDPVHKMYVGSEKAGGTGFKKHGQKN